MEDEWEREPDSEVDLDLLFVTYHADKTNVEQLTKTIEQQGFTAELKQEP